MSKIISSFGEKPPLDEFAHHGVKGMKWGVVRDRASALNRNLGDIHTEKVNRGLAINDRVASGHGSAVDKLKVLSATPTSRVVTRGLKGAAAKNAELQRAHLQRMSTGKATVGDLLAQYGHISARDAANAALRTAQGR